MGLAGPFGISGKWMDLKVGDWKIARLAMEIQQDKSGLFFIKMASHHVHCFITSFFHFMTCSGPCFHVNTCRFVLVDLSMSHFQGGAVTSFTRPFLMAVQALSNLFATTCSSFFSHVSEYFLRINGGEPFGF